MPTSRTHRDDQVAISSREISTPPIVELVRQPRVGLDSLLRARCREAGRDSVRPGELLDAVADGERGDEQHHRRGVPHGPEGDQLHQQGEDRHDQDGHQDHPEPAPAPREEHRVGTGHDQLAVGEVHEAHDVEEEREPQRHQRRRGCRRRASRACTGCRRRGGHRRWRRTRPRRSPCRCRPSRSRRSGRAPPSVPWNWIRPPSA